MTESDEESWHARMARKFGGAPNLPDLGDDLIALHLAASLPIAEPAFRAPSVRDLLAGKRRSADLLAVFRAVCRASGCPTSSPAKSAKWLTAAARARGLAGNLPSAKRLAGYFKPAARQKPGAKRTEAQRTLYLLCRCIAPRFRTFAEAADWVLRTASAELQSREPPSVKQIEEWLEQGHF